MTRLSIILAAMLMIGIGLNAADTPQHEYSGMMKCKICHQKEKNGMIYEKWLETPHAKAYETLGTDKAKEVYKAKMGKDGNPQTDAACLKCHTTGHGVDAKFTAKLKIEEGVTCESCHGAGADYGKMDVMKDHAASVAAGMTDKAIDGCVKCHNSESPTYKEFKKDEFYIKIEHKVPPKQG